jgi:hypothetical protein
MAVSRCTITGIDYWKVYRYWGDKPAQRYFRVDKPNARESLKKANAEDQSLRSRQRAYLTRQVFDLDYHILDDGKLRGVRRVTVIREGRNPKEAFAVRIKLPWETKPAFTSVSIDRHGVDAAFDRVVRYYCDVYGFDERSEMRSALRECVGAYKTRIRLQTLSQTLPERESNDDDWAAAMEREIAAYKPRDRKTISGR